MLEVIRWLVLGAGVYFAFGLVFAVAFALRGVHRIDAAAHGAGWMFRVLIVPGSAVFWPLLWRRWSRPRAAGFDLSRETDDIDFGDGRNARSVTAPASPTAAAASESGWADPDSDTAGVGR